MGVQKEDKNGFPFLSLREKAELRGIVERDDRFAMLLEECTNEGSRILWDGN